MLCLFICREGSGYGGRELPPKSFRSQNINLVRTWRVSYFKVDYTTWNFDIIQSSIISETNLLVLDHFN